MVRHWDRLSNDVMDALTLKAFKVDGALRNQVWWMVFLLIAEGLELNAPKAPFQPKPFLVVLTGKLGVTFSSLLHAYPQR